MSMINRFCFIGLLITSVGLWAAPASNQPLVTDASHYSLGAGDVVRLSVYDHPELSLEAEIAPDGTLNVPLIGAVSMAGLTFKQAEGQIHNKFVSGGYLKDPHVNLLITQYRSQLVSVLGEVNQPGRYPLSGDTSLISLLAAAGGISQSGGAEITLIHNGASQYYDLTNLGKPDQAINQVKVQPGDRVFVPKQKMIFVYGEVLRPGTYPLTSNMTVMKAIAVAGGFTGKASKRNIELQRPASKGGVDNKETDLATLLQADDVVYVNESLF